MVSQRVETRDEAIVRLAETARRRGIRILYHRDLRGVETFYATSWSQTGRLYRVTLLSCDCDGFIQHQRCTHHSAFLAEIGELPEPEPPAVDLVAAAQAEVNRRLSTAKSLADFRNLQAARATLAELTAGVDPAVDAQRFAAMMAA